MSEAQSAAIFNQVAQEYDAIRPGYPPALIEDIIAISRLPGNGRMLEIGCGSGQATLPFAQRGYDMLCLDIGKQLVAIAERKLQAHTDVRFQIVSFEDWPAEENSFDLFMSATAFHWIPPHIGYPKAARVLKDSGYIAIFSNHHPRENSGFFVDVQEVYHRVLPEWADIRTLPSLDETIAATAATMDACGCFEKVEVRRYSWAINYTADQYVRLLNTYSDHGALEEGKRNRLYAGISEHIERRGGVITRPYLSVLYIARKQPSC